MEFENEYEKIMGIVEKYQVQLNNGKKNYTLNRIYKGNKTIYGNGKKLHRINGYTKEISDEEWDNAMSMYPEMSYARIAAWLGISRNTLFLYRKMENK